MGGGSPVAKGPAAQQAAFPRARSCRLRSKFAVDSLLEQSGFELVWGFSCQVVVLGFAESSLFGGVSR